MGKQLTCLQIGRDEFRFAEKDLSVAEMLAAELPRWRQTALTVAGHSGPGVIRIVITAHAPRARDVIAFTRDGKLAWGLALALTLPGMVLLAQLALSDTLMLVTLCVALILILSSIAYVWWRFTRHIARIWNETGGLAFMQSSRSLPVMALHWPRPTRVMPPAVAEMLNSTDDPSVAIHFAAAHEYGHFLLRDIKHTYQPPVWLDEGFAFWFGEQVVGRSFWLPKSRVCLMEEETTQDPRRTLTPHDEHYLRLMARYYWEVRTLAEQGKLQEALRASSKELEAMRPKLHAEGNVQKSQQELG